MTVKNRFSKLLTDPVKDRPVLDAIASTGEAVADIVMKDELLSAVPFVGTAFKAAKAIDSYRDRLFAAKLQAFVAEVEPLQSAEREELAKKLTADDEGRKAGETLLLVLDKLTDMDKPALLGLLLRRFGEGRVASPELRRLASAIELAFADDLAAFLNESKAELDKSSDAEHREALVAVGLTRIKTEVTYSGIGQIAFETTFMGALLHSLATGAEVAQ